MKKVILTITMAATLLFAWDSPLLAATVYTYNITGVNNPPTAYATFVDAVTADGLVPPTPLPGENATFNLLNPSPNGDLVNTPMSSSPGYYNFYGSGSHVYDKLIVVGQTSGQYKLGFAPGAANDVRLMGITDSANITLSNLEISGGDLKTQTSFGATNIYGGRSLFISNPSSHPLVTANINNAKIHHNNTNMNLTGSIIAAGAVMIFPFSGGSPASVVTFDGVELSNNTVAMTSNNSGSLVYGAGLYSGYMPTLIYKNGIVQNNTVTLNGLGAGAYGGGIRITSSPSILIQNTAFLNNSAINNVTNTNNLARGGGIYFTGTSAGSLVGNTFSGNTSTSAAGEARGGATGINSTNTVTGPVFALSNNSYTNNTATGATFARGGAIYSARTLSSSGDTFSANKATATGVGGLAQGGAMLVISGTASLVIPDSSGSPDDRDATVSGTPEVSTISNASFTGNMAQATNMGGQAQGGAIDFEGGSILALSGSNFSDNTASGTLTSKGGAIYVKQGALNLTDSSLTGNQALGAGGQGGAIYMNNALSAAAILNLTANDGKTSIISGNSAAGVANQGVYFGGTGATPAVFNVHTNNSGYVVLDDATTVNLPNSTFIFTKNGAGTLDWNGINSFNTGTHTTQINLLGGTTYLGETFTAKAAGTGTYSVNIQNGAPPSSIKFNLARDPNLPMFDFGTSTTRNLSIAPGAKLDIFPYRRIATFTDEYIFAGVLPDYTYNNEFDISNTIITSVYKNAANNVVIGISHVNPYDTAGVNPNNAKYAVIDLVSQKDANGQYIISDAEAKAIYHNPWATQPELYMDMGTIMANEIDSVATKALYSGMIAPQHASLAARGPAQNLSTIPAAGELASAQKSDLRTWAAYIGDSGGIDANDKYNGYDFDHNGIIGGIAYDFGPGASVGFYAGYTHTDAKANRISSKNDAEAGHLGLMGRLSPLEDAPGFSIYGDVGYHLSENDISRSFDGYTAEGSFDQQAVTTGLAAEYVFTFDNLQVTPALKARYIHVAQEGLDETGLTATSTDGFDVDAFNTRLGAEAAYSIETQSGVIIPSLHAYWRHEFGAENETTHAFYIQDPSPTDFIVESHVIERDLADIGASVKTLFDIDDAHRFGVNAGYSLNTSGNQNTHSLYFGMELNF